MCGPNLEGCKVSLTVSWHKVSCAFDACCKRGEWFTTQNGYGWRYYAHIKIVVPGIHDFFSDVEGCAHEEFTSVGEVLQRFDFHDGFRPLCWYPLNSSTRIADKNKTLPDVCVHLIKEKKEREIFVC